MGNGLRKTPRVYDQSFVQKLDKEGYLDRVYSEITAGAK